MRRQTPYRTTLTAIACTSSIQLLTVRNGFAHANHDHDPSATDTATTEPSPSPASGASPSPTADAPSISSENTSPESPAPEPAPPVPSAANLSEGLSTGLGESLLVLMIAAPWLLIALKKRIQA